jgi:alkanesulfonate monooxygenase SsuD/methylene tetrahydromethanopterin reductase-like flavin-dependent oxidoreductase (luciferase family)
MRLDVHAIPVNGRWEQHVEAILAVEAAGFDRVWVADHLSAGMFGGTGLYECFSQLAYLAAVTTRVGLGSLVVNATNRRAGMLAVSAASVQEMSGGRLWLGLGAGTSPSSPFAEEQHAVGNPPRVRLVDRHQHLLEVLDELARFWGDGAAAGFLRPVPRPPTLLGVNSVALARLAGARTHGVNVRWSHPARAAILEAARQGRATREIHPGVWTTSVWLPWDADLTDPSHPLRHELAAEGVDRLVLMWMEPPATAEIERAGRHLR